MSLIFKSVNFQQSRIPFIMWVGVTQSVEVFKKNKTKT